MKKLLRALAIILLLGAGFWYMIINTQILNKFLPNQEVVTETKVITESDLFVNPNVCTKKHTREEYTAYRQEQCQTTNSCEQRQQDVSDIVFADRHCYTDTDTIIRLLNTDNATGFATLIDQGIVEMKTLGKLPRFVYHNILETEIGFDAGFIDDTIELTGIVITGMDFSRVFISFEGQDLMMPTLNILVQKGPFIVSLQNEILRDQYGDTPIQPIIDTYSTWVNQKVNEVQSSDFSFPPSDIIDFYHQHFETNEAYQTVFQNKLTKSLSLFVTE